MTEKPAPRPREDAASLEAAGWTPPTTIGGTWCRVSPEGIYEMWPRPATSYDAVLSDGIKALLDNTTATWEKNRETFKTLENDINEHRAD